MANLKQLKEITLNLPETSEGTHFRSLCYKVLDKPFIAIEKDNTHIMINMDKDEVQKLVAENPVVYSEVWQAKKYLVGVRLNLEHVSAKQLQHLVELGWKNKAPKKLTLEPGKKNH